jgi:hypothetical protein
MENLMRYIILLISITILVSCNVCAQPDKVNSLYNTWVKYNDDYSDPNTFRSTAKLDDNRYGFIIEPDGTFIERKNIGWCGTPPISYGNFDGKWKYVSDGTLEIIVDFWGGTDTFKIEILSVNDSELKINYVYNYE